MIFFSSGQTKSGGLFRRKGSQHMDKDPHSKDLRGELYPEGLQGNSTPINPHVPVTPLYTTHPLTDYRYSVRNGRQVFRIDDREVEQLRDFSIENKK